MDKNIMMNYSKSRIIVPFVIAKDLMSINFDLPCFWIYRNNGKEFYQIITANTFQFSSPQDYVEGDVPAPLWHQVFEWAREVHELIVEITYLKSKHGVTFKYSIESLALPKDDQLLEDDKKYDEYEMINDYENISENYALEYERYWVAEYAAVKELIKIIKNKAIQPQ